MITFDVIKPQWVSKRTGYIAGESPGILTINGQPAVRFVYAFDADTLRIESLTSSQPDGTYRLRNLEPNKKYLVIARDSEGKYEPVAYDYVTPALENGS